MTGKGIPFLDLGAVYRELRDEFDAAYYRVMESGHYLLGPELEAFEREFADFTGGGHCAGVASGLDALVLGLRALDVGPGDEVIVPSNTFIATWLAVSAVGATIVPVEPDPLTCNLTGPAVEAAMSNRTAVILPVHLYGLPADVRGIAEVGRRHGVPIFYDAAQAHGARVDSQPIGTFGDLSAWSFYPGKNLGAFGDAGAVTGRDSALIERVRRLRNYGSTIKYHNDERGVNSRLDELQAAMLRVKLSRLDDWNDRRRQVARLYQSELGGFGIGIPIEPQGAESAWHLFVVQVRNRDRTQELLEKAGVRCLIHYPIPPHRQLAYSGMENAGLPIAERLASTVLSLPIGPHLGVDGAAEVVTAVRDVLEATGCTGEWS
jgi:dTDP-4-amino-4,6-dideoxygalactose transaminase